MIPIIGKKQQQPTAEQASIEAIQKTTGAVLSVLGCGTRTFGEGLDVCSSASGNLLAAVYPNSEEEAEAFIKEKIVSGILQVYRSQIANMKAAQKEGAGVQ